jgi:1,4-dihydroxy-6-naphthoate synthase
MKKISIGISSCPNDTFAFAAIFNKLIDTKNYEFNFHISDIEQLNKKAFNSEFDVTKISFFTYAQISKNYQILNSGNAIGNNNGPLLVGKRKIYKDEINDLKIAIPGKNTTANLLLSTLFPNANKKTEYLFSEIEDVILSNEMDAGLIIHENRFTYHEKNLLKIVDLGEEWQNLTKMMIPLGGIIIKRTFDEKTKNEIDTIIKNSIEFAFKNWNLVYKFIKQYAQNLDDEVIKKHIDLYVNKHTIDLGIEGKNSINFLLNQVEKLELCEKIEKPVFI